MTWLEWLCPVVTVNARQAARIRRMHVQLCERELQIDALTARLRRIQSDVELLACSIPPDKRDLALSLVRDRHRIEDGRIIEEAAG